MADDDRKKKLVMVVVVAPLLLVVILQLAGFAFVWLGWRSIPFQVTPLTIVKYLLLYWDDPALHKRFAISLGVPALLALVGLLAIVFYKPRSTLYGNGRWANLRELKRAQMLSGEGIILGELNGTFVFSHPEHHVQLQAPTGTGKGVAIVLPVLLSWNGSVVVNDIKGENFEMTSKFRAAFGHKVYVFNPADKERRTHRWNPLAYLSEDPLLQGKEIQQIAAMLWPPHEDKGEPWKPGARGLFSACVRWLIENGEEPTLPKVGRFAATIDEKEIKAAIKARHEAQNPFSPELVTGFAQFLNLPDKFRESVRGEFNTGFEVITSDPLLSLALSGNDFDLRRLRKDPMSVYTITPGPDLARLQRIINLFYQQVSSLNSETEFGQEPDHRHQVMLLLDEMTSMGDVAAVVDKISYYRSYGIKLVTIYQSETQVKQVYGEMRAGTFRDNHKTRLAYTPVDKEEGERISKALPSTTSFSKSKSGRKGERKSYSENEAARQLMIPDEVMLMPEEELIAFAPNIYPVKLRKVRYFEHPMFVDRLKAVSPILRAAGKPERKHFTAARLAGELKVEIPSLERPAVTETASIAWIAEPEKQFKPADADDIARIASMPMEDIRVNGVELSNPPQDVVEGTPEEKREYAAKLINAIFADDEDDDSLD